MAVCAGISLAMQTQAAHKSGLHVREVLGDFLSWLALDHDMLLPKVHYEQLLAARLYATERALLAKDSYGYAYGYGSLDSSRMATSSERGQGAKDSRDSLAPSRDGAAQNGPLCRNLNDTLRGGGLKRSLEFGDPPRRSYESFVESPSLFSRRSSLAQDPAACGSPATGGSSGVSGSESRSGLSDDGGVVRTSPYDVRSLLGKRPRSAREDRAEEEKEEESERKSPSEDKRVRGEDRPGRFPGHFPPRLSGGDYYYSNGLYDKLHNGFYDKLNNGLYDKVNNGLYDKQNSGLYDKLNSGLYDKLNSGMYDKLNSGVYDKLNSGMYDKLNSGLYDKLNSGVYDKLNSGVYDKLNSGVYENSGLYDKLNSALKTSSGLSPHALMLPPPPSPLIPSPPHDFGRREDFPACSCPRCVPRGDIKSSPSISPSASSATSPESSRSELHLLLTVKLKTFFLFFFFFLNCVSTEPSFWDERLLFLLLFVYLGTVVVLLLPLNFLFFFFFLSFSSLPFFFLPSLLLL